jgi:hypothetical protein
MNPITSVSDSDLTSGLEDITNELHGAVLFLTTEHFLS